MMDYTLLHQLLEERQYVELKKAYRNLQSADIAEFIEEVNESRLLLAFRLLPKEMAVDVFAFLPLDLQVQISDLVNEKELGNIINDLSFDDKVDLLEEMPANVVKKILSNTPDLERRWINQFLMYSEHSAGSIMTIEFVDLNKEMTAGEAFEHIRKTGINKETIYTCYVIDAKRHLEGTLSLKTLIIADSEVQVGDIMKQHPIYLNTHDDQEHVANQFKKYDLIAAPVVDAEQRLVGIITVDDIIDVIDTEATEDFYKMAAITPNEETYLNTGVFKLASRRIVWLSLLMISATLTGFIINHYRATLQAAVVLTAFIPMLMDTGGNAGSQASTLVIRSLVLGEVQRRDFLKILWKEIRVSTLVGLVLSVFNFIRIYLTNRDLTLALTVAVTLFLTVVIAKMIGSMLPLIAKRIKMDPAVMSSPVITTIVDAVALIIYFQFAMQFMNL